MYPSHKSVRPPSSDWYEQAVHTHPDSRSRVAFFWVLNLRQLREPHWQPIIVSLRGVRKREKKKMEQWKLHLRHQPVQPVHQRANNNNHRWHIIGLISRSAGPDPFRLLTLAREASSWCLFKYLVDKFSLAMAWLLHASSNWTGLPDVGDTCTWSEPWFVNSTFENFSDLAFAHDAQTWKASWCRSSTVVWSKLLPQDLLSDNPDLVCPTHSSLLESSSPSA